MTENHLHNFAFSPYDLLNAGQGSPGEGASEDGWGKYKAREHLESLEQGEREKRQRLIDELEAKDAELYETLKTTCQKPSDRSSLGCCCYFASQLSQSSSSSPSKPWPSSTTNSLLPASALPHLPSDIPLPSTPPHLSPHFPLRLLPRPPLPLQKLPLLTGNWGRKHVAGGKRSLAIRGRGATGAEDHTRGSKIGD